MREILRLARRAWFFFRSQGTHSLLAALGDRMRGRSSAAQQEYSEWIERNEPSQAELERIRKAISTWQDPPLISVIMPVFNTPEVWLNRAILSVQAQIYPNWELCIADDASTDLGTRLLLETFSATDCRIRVEFRSINGHISQASNTALTMAHGAYVALLDHDDELHPLALAHVALAIRQNPGVQIIYSDEDKLDAQGRRVSPYFKPSFNYELFLSHNMISHLGVYRKDLIERLGGFCDAFVGAQDYDLALRGIENISPQQVVHIPKILYHWRIHAKGTAFRADTKPYAVQAALRAVSAHLDRIGMPVFVEENNEASGMHRIRFQTCTPTPTVELLLYGALDGKCWQIALEAFSQNRDAANCRINLIGPNRCDFQTQNSDKSAAIFPSQSQRLAWNENEALYPLINAAAENSQAEFICLVDARLRPLNPGWLEELLMHGRRSGVGAVGSRIWGADGRLKHAGMIVGASGCAASAHAGLPRHARGYFGRAVLLQEFSALSPACLFIRRETFVQAGGFDTGHYRSDLGCVDLCLRLREQGLRNLWTPHAELRYGIAAKDSKPASLDSMRSQQEIEFFHRRWQRYCLDDPCYSPNLSLADGNFSLACRARSSQPDFSA